VDVTPYIYSFNEDMWIDLRLAMQLVVCLRNDAVV
jgi:hypothetical protein